MVNGVAENKAWAGVATCRTLSTQTIQLDQCRNDKKFQYHPIQNVLIILACDALVMRPLRRKLRYVRAIFS